MAGVNRVGHENGDVLGNRVHGQGLEFWGGSFLADPFGRIIARASHDAEEILMGEIDLGGAGTAQGWQPGHQADHQRENAEECPHPAPAPDTGQWIKRQIEPIEADPDRRLGKINMALR